jgi:ankyrin repeat protein
MKPLRCICCMLAVALVASKILAAAGDLRLVEAVQRQDREAVRSLLEAHVDVNASQPDGATAIAWAAHWDDLGSAELLIRAGANVNAPNEYGVTPLALACSNGSAAMVEKLLQSGANPNVSQNSGVTPLMLCARSGSLEAVKLMTARGADPNAKESYKGQTALMWAVAEKHSAVVPALLEARADANARSGGGFTPLMFAAQQGDLQSAQFLATASANINDATPQGMTPLLVAVSSGRAEVSLFLLEKGADPNAADSRGFTSLHFAAQNRNLIEALKALLAKGASPNSQLTRGDVGATPIYLAANAGNVAAIRELASAGGNPNLPTKDGTTPLLVASGVGRFESRGEAQDRSAFDVVKLLLELGSDVSAVGENSWTAMHGASYTGSDAIIQALADRGAKLDVFDRFGQTPLSIAEAVVTKGLGENADVRPRRLRESTVALLLKLGATPTDRAGVEAVGSMAVKP